MKILAIETSCDETAAAMIEANHHKSELKIEILANIVSSQIEIHQKFGGVFPEYASRAHAERILPVVISALLQAEGISLSSEPSTLKSNSHRPKSMVPALAGFLAERVGCVESLDETTAGTFDGYWRALNSLESVDLIAVTTGPGLIGSLLVGVNFAKTLAYLSNKPIIGINHLLGHIYSNFIQSEPIATQSKSRVSDIPQFPAIILIVSGGHTGLALMKNHHEIQTLGETLDDAAGEAFDKVAKLLQLGYPGGPAISAAAEKFKMTMQNIKFPRSMLSRKDYNFSFSGLKTAVLYKIKELESQGITINHYKSLIAREFQQTVIDILIGKTIKAAYEFRPKSILLCGGVSANKELRQQLKEAVEKLPSKPLYHLPPMALTTDNAAMIGIAAAYQSSNKYTTWDKIHAEANLKL